MHIAIYLANQQDRAALLERITTENALAEWIDLKGKKLAVFSKAQLHYYLNEEYRHDRVALTQFDDRRLADLSEGEQKTRLLESVLAQKPDVLVVDDVLDSFDANKQHDVVAVLVEFAGDAEVVQLMSRYQDKLPFIQQVLTWHQHQFTPFHQAASQAAFSQPLPPIPEPFVAPAQFTNPLIKLDKVSVSFAQKPVLHELSWVVNQGEFWQLSGANGSGKSTLLRMISGDNPKGFGQNLFLFGRKKGTGESVWEIKAHIGYFTSSMTQNFSRDETVLAMLISGYFDSVGLYLKPHRRHIQLAQQWLALLGMEALAEVSFMQLGYGQQRLLLAARAMVKHPPLLILDEPTAGLDDEHAALLVRLVNHMASCKTSAIMYVSHRREEGLHPEKILHLQTSDKGSIGVVTQG